jgi:hypothetical protein
MTHDLLDRILGEIRDRKREAQAAYEESQQLERALAALGPDAPAPPRGATRPGRRASKPGRRQARRGANRDAILEALRERPGATAREIADATGIARTIVASTLTRLAANAELERSELPAGGVGFRVSAS